MKTKLHIPEDSDKIKFKEKISKILSNYAPSQIIHIEFMERTSSLNNVIYVAYILVRDD